MTSTLENTSCYYKNIKNNLDRYIMEWLRKLAHKTIFKFFLFFVASTFIIFGIAEFVFGGSKYNVASVGEHDITIMQFNSEVQKYKDILYKQNPSQQTTDYLSSKQFKLEILDEMVAGYLLDTSAKNLGFRISNEAIVDDVLKNQMFLDEDGKFNKNIFNNFLTRNNLTEEDYINRQRSSISREVVADIFSNINKFNPKRVEQLGKYRNEVRIVDMMTITEKSLAKQPTYTNEELQEYYEQNQNQFIIPDMKKISYVEIIPSEMQKTIKIDEELIKSSYEENKANFIQSESRDIYVLHFNNKAEADSIKSKISSEADFIAQAKELGKTKESITVTGLTRDKVFKEIANPIFTAQKNEITDVVSVNDTKFYIMFIKNITPEKQLTYLEVKEDIQNMLVNSELEENLSSLISGLEDDILGANNIKELAEKYSLELKTVNPFDSNTTKNIFNSTNGNGKKLITASFELMQGEFSEIISLADSDKYILLFNEEDIPSRIQDFAEVKNNISAIVKRNKVNKELSDLVAKISKNLDKNIPMKNLAMRNNATFEANNEITRDTTRLSKAIFKAKLNQSIKPMKTGLSEYKIAFIKEIKESDEGLDVSKIENELSNAVMQDLLYGYEIHLRTEHPVKVRMNNIDMIQ